VIFDCYINQDKFLKEKEHGPGISFYTFLKVKNLIVESATRKLQLEKYVKRLNQLQKIYNCKSRAKDIRKYKNQLYEVNIRLDLLLKLIPDKDGITFKEDVISALNSIELLYDPSEEDEEVEA